jgi:hypothetical protein
MPPPHPITSLSRGGPAGLAMAIAQLRQSLALHGGNVAAAAASLDPPVDETTLHDWITRLGIDDARRGREAAAVAAGQARAEAPKKKKRGPRKTP